MQLSIAELKLRQKFKTNVVAYINYAMTCYKNHFCFYESTRVASPTY